MLLENSFHNQNRTSHLREIVDKKLFCKCMQPLIKDKHLRWHRRRSKTYVEIKPASKLCATKSSGLICIVFSLGFALYSDLYCIQYRIWIVVSAYFIAGIYSNVMHIHITYIYTTKKKELEQNMTILFPARFRHFVCDEGLWTISSTFFDQQQRSNRETDPRDHEQWIYNR